MHKETVSGVSEVDGEKVSYEGEVQLFDSVEEYVSWLQTKAGGKMKAEDAAQRPVHAINDFEMRRQRQGLRPGRTKATGAGEINKIVNAALREGKASPEDVKAALATLGLE
jgi:hypothetical protein